ncbi:MAG TPA: HdeD family acid-resistance protein [Dongiaceae bacterium]|jgi:uncharacterized membrane protein HdeD (DUF308 family)|nr:HdeD family acid-resistance protein [Dongiaceae bacterium]
MPRILFYAFPWGAAWWRGSESVPLSRALARNWWVIALRGILAIAFGIVAFFWPGLTLLGLVWVFAAYRLADGVIGIVSAIRAAERGRQWVTLLLEGLLNIALSALAIFLPGITVLVFIYLLAVWSVAGGLLLLFSSSRLHRNHGQFWFIFTGAISVIFGVALFFAPLSGAFVLTWWLGAFSLVFGLGLLALSLKLRHRHIHFSSGISEETNSL